MAAGAGLGLSRVADADLKALAGALERGDLCAPFGVTALQSRGFGHLADALEPFLALDTHGLRAVIGAVLAERHHRKPPALTLVWTGDDPGIGHTRHTRIVLPELFGRAREHVLVAGYSFDSGELFTTLHQVMLEHGVSADFFLDVQQLLERLRVAARREKLDWPLLSAAVDSAREPRARGEAAIALFFKLIWPHTDVRPTVYFDPRTADPVSAVSLHAKCVVIDHQLSLITSANFTARGQTRNLEAGVSIDDRAFATSLERQWANLVTAGVVVRATA